MFSLKVKQMLLALLFIVSIPFVCGGTCDDTPSSTPKAPRTTVTSTMSGGDYRKCQSLTCTYKKDGDIRTAMMGVQINLATAVTLGGTWK